MFSGIVEAQAKVLVADLASGAGPLIVEKPSHINDLKSGDSVSVNGICLTVERVDDSRIQFFVGKETARVTGWAQTGVQTGEFLNLERSLSWGTRIHGHFVTGHVDRSSAILGVEDYGSGRDILIHLPVADLPLIWQKGSVAINGVSLTIHQVGPDFFRVSLIPETLRRTNLGRLQRDDRVLVEYDNMARAMWNWRNLEFESTPEIKNE